MKPTIRASIGSIVFNLEDDAYNLLDDYFKTLKGHLGTDQEGKETFKDIEYRLVELLQLRLNHKEGVYTLDDVFSVLNIMGNPADFGNPQEQHEGEEYEEETKQKTKRINTKRLYRDKVNGIIAGVCSGLSHYFRIDVVIIRLLFLIPLLFGAFFLDNWIVGVVLLYFILWVVVPKATTFEDKVKMAGNLSNSDRESYKIKKYRGSGLKEVLKAVYKFILVMVGIIALLMLIAVVAFIIWSNFDTSVLYLDNYLSLVGQDSLNLKVAIALLTLLPLIGLCNLLYKLYKESSFKIQNLILSLLGVALWIGAAIYLGSLGTEYYHKLHFKEELREPIAMSTNSEILYIKLADEYEQANVQPLMSKLLYKKGSLDKNDVCMVDDIYSEGIGDEGEIQVELVKVGIGSDKLTARMNAKNKQLKYTVQDSLITIYPEWHNADHPWEFSQAHIKIKLPQNKEVKFLGYLNDLR